MNARALGAAAFALLLASCSSSPAPEEEQLPASRGLLRRSAAEMRTVQTVHFDIVAEGEISGLPVRSASGVLTAEGEAEGTVEIEQGGSLVEFLFTVDGSFFYVKGPTGGYQTIPRFLATRFYDPTKLLDPDDGLAELLATAEPGTTQARESVAGQDAFRLTATLDGDQVRSLIPLESEQTEVPARVWIGADRSLLVRIDVAFESDDGSQANLIVTLSDHDDPVQIDRPE